MYTDWKQKLWGAVSKVTLLPIASSLKAFGMHTTLQQRSMKRTFRLLEVIQLVKKFNSAQLVMATLTSSTVNIISNNDWCVVFGKTSHIGHHCPDVQCYNCEEFGHLTRDCPHKIPPLGTPCHHNMSHSQSHYSHNYRDRSQSQNYRHSHGRHFDHSWSHHQSHHNGSSSNYWDIAILINWSNQPISLVKSYKKYYLTICLVLGRATAQQPNICKNPQSSLYSWTTVHKTKIGCCHLMWIPLATRWQMLGIPLPLSQFQPYCIAAFWATAVFYLLISWLFLKSINYFCWIVLVCIYRHAFRHILGFLPSLSVLNVINMVHDQHVFTHGMYLPFCFLSPA